MRRSPSIAPAPELVTHLHPMAGGAEAFRVLRTNLQFMGLDRPLRSVLITSAVPGEGKSTVAANLAVAFAQSGANVCLVDADLRRPRVAKLFAVENWRGLTNAVVSQNGLEADLQPSGVSGLSLLTSGPIPPNPAEMLGSARMTQLLSNLEQRFEMVILDSPPTLAVTDAAVLAPKVGGVILVARSGKVARQQAQRAVTSLQAVKANLLGVTLSAVPQDEKDGYYYYYYSEEQGGPIGKR
ncbi:MAG: CpsD/CapB family tyrosine-protein kinase [Bacillota bacterium]